MKLETLEQRYELVKQMLAEAIELESEFDCLEDDNDWGGAVVTWENLRALEEMICTEEIFLNALDDMEGVPTHDLDEKEEFTDILLADGLYSFGKTILLPRLEQTRDVLNTWGFRNERGKEFKEDFCEKFDALIREYYNLYDL